MNKVVKFTFKPNVFSGRFFFWIGPWEGQPLRDWYCGAWGLGDPNGFLGDEHFVDSSQYDGRACYPTNTYPIIMLKEPPFTPSVIGSLAHEIEHGVNRYLEALGVHYCWQSEEVYAYLKGELMECVLEYCWHGKQLPGLHV